LQIAPNVRCVTVGDRDNDVYLVSGERAAFIDSGHGTDDEIASLLDEWRDAGSPEVAAIVLTHRHLDHVGGARALAAATGGVVVSSPVERSHIEDVGGEVGRTVKDGETLDLGGATLEFVHTPGHTMGSLCVLYREESVLFTGDTVLGTGTTSVNPEHGDMEAYLDSLRRLLFYESDVIAPGHGPAIRQPKANLEALIGHRLKRERQVLDMVGEAPSTVDDLFQALYARLDPRLHETARRQVRAHLAKLEREGRVLRTDAPERYVLR